MRMRLFFKASYLFLKIEGLHLKKRGEIMKKAKDVMNRELITIDSKEQLDKIVELMKKLGIGRLPVLESGELIGVVSRDDILYKEEDAPLPPVIALWDVIIALPQSREFEKKVKKMAGYMAKEIMTTEYLLVEEEDTVKEIVTKMLTKKYSYALVGSKDKLLGIITKSDLINKIY